MRTAPAVPGHFLLGSLAEFRRDRIGLLTRVAREYGDIAQINVGLLLRGLIVSAPELVRETLVEHSDDFIKGVALTVFGRPLLGNGLLTSEHNFHHRQRRLMAPAFMPRRIATYAETIAGYTERSLARLHGREHVDLAQELMQTTLEIAGKTLFDADLSGDADEIGRAVTAAMRRFNDQISAALPTPPQIPSPGNLRGRRVIKRLDDVVYRLIRERRASGRDVGDFLSMLLLAQDEDDGSVMTDKQVRDEAMTILLAGHETTANALTWTFYLLAQHPEARAELEHELDRVLAGRRPVLADLPRLPYTMQVFKEAMRLYPPAFMIVRRALRTVAIGGQELRKGECVLLNTVGMQRRAEYFPEPLRFAPERFAPEREKQLDKYAYLPFGGGPRICIGNHFALMEGQIVLAQLAQHLHFDLLPGAAPVTLEPLITLRPKGGMPMRVTPRAPRPHLRAAGA